MSILIFFVRLQIKIERQIKHIKKHISLKDIVVLSLILLVMCTVVTFIYFTFIMPTNVYTTRGIPFFINPIQMGGITFIVIFMLFLEKKGFFDYLISRFGGETVDA